MLLAACPHGAFPTIRHNDIRDLTARLLSEVCHDVQVEPHLQLLTGEVLHYRTTVLEDDARFDIRAAGFWGCRHHRLANLLSDRWNSPYSLIMGWLRCSLGFSLLRSSLMCLRGSRSSSGSPGVPAAVDLVVAEGHLATSSD